MIRLTTLLLLLIATSNIFAQDLSNATYYKFGDVDTNIIYPFPKGHIVEHDHRLKMDDGIEISINIYRPDTKNKVPVLIAFTDYNKDIKAHTYLTATRGGVYRAIGTELGSFTVSDETPWEGPDPAFWVENGYAVIVADARGTGKSTGKHDPFGLKTQQSFANVVEWASEQPWSTGKVGTTGTSYLGIIQWYVAALRPKGLEAISVWHGLTDFDRDSACPGGIQETAFIPAWLAGDRSGMRKGTKPQFGMTDLPEICSIKNISHHSFPPINVEKINVPTLVAATWSVQGIHTRGGFEGYKRLQTDKYLYTHGRHEWTVSNSDEARQYQKSFFDYYLKDKKSAKKKLQKVRLEVMTGNGGLYVREESNWPLENTQYKKFHLNSFEKTLSEKTLEINTFTQYRSTDLNDELTYRLTFDKDTEIVGNSKLKLWVSTSAGNDMDMFVAIRKLDKDGKVMHFRNLQQETPIATRGWLRVSMRKLDKKLASDIQPVLAMNEYQPIKPREIVPVEIEIFPMAVLFEQGTTLELVMKGSDIYYEPYSQHKKLVNMGHHQIYSGRDHDSYLVLPIVN